MALRWHYFYVSAKACQLNRKQQSCMLASFMPYKWNQSYPLREKTQYNMMKNLNNTSESRPFMAFNIDEADNDLYL